MAKIANVAAEPEYIVKLIRRGLTVSVATVEMSEALPELREEH